MAKLDKHISELLYDHECVIVPDLGGFLSSYAPSTIHPAQHVVTPPSKKIAFNVFLRHNDGLLANHLVQSESVSYPEALRDIERYVEICNSELAAGKKIVIERVGVLTRDAETNIQFEPFNNVNYLKGSFGLSPVQFIPLTNTNFEEQVEKQLRDFISLRPSRSQQRKPLVRRKTRLNALNTVLLSGSILWLCLNVYLVAPAKLDFASLNPFSVNTSDYQPVTTTATVKQEIYTQPASPQPETVYVSSVNPVAAQGLSSPNNNPSYEAERRSFFIVAGAFKSHRNANRQKEELKSMGFLNAGVVENNDGLKLVCYDSFPTREAAMTELNRLKVMNKDAWIFRR